MTALPETLDEMISDPNLVIKLAIQVRDAREQLVLAEAETVESQKALVQAQPKVDFADAVMDSGETIKLETMAAYIDIGRTTFYRKLRNDDIINNNNKPYRKYVNCGYFDVSEGIFQTESGHTRLATFVGVTPKGQLWLVKKYGTKD